MKNALLLILLISPSLFFGQAAPPDHDPRIYDIIGEVSAERIETDIRKLANFGTRHTLSDTLSTTRGIGAARRWIKNQFDQISSECGNCLEVKYHNPHRHYCQPM